MHVFTYNLLNYLNNINSYSDQFTKLFTDKKSFLLESNYKKILDDYHKLFFSQADNQDTKEQYESFSEINDHYFNSINNNIYNKKSDAKLLFEQGSVKLLDYGYKLGSPISNLFIVPSLVNRAYIFDLEDNNSFVKSLLELNIRPLLLIWDHPQTNELHFSVNDYIEQHIIPAINIINQKIDLLGYCMGGIFSMILQSQYNINNINKVILLATPWDFDYVLGHAKEEQRAKIAKELEKLIDNYNPQYVPYYVISSIICYWQFSIIFNKYNRCKKNLNLNLEQWAYDGINMTRNMFKTCFIDWILNNNLCKDDFLEKISLSKRENILLINATKDRIVPNKSSRKLKQKLNIEQKNYNTSHTGLIIDQKITRGLQKDIFAWLNNR